MRCLAVRQPWAWGIIVGGKDIENRSWSTEYRGVVVIQASSTKTEVNRLAKAKGLPALGLVHSALIGVVDLVDVVPLSESLEANPWAWGPQCLPDVNYKSPLTTTIIPHRSPSPFASPS
jgi:hypothetical protein